VLLLVARVGPRGMAVVCMVEQTQVLGHFDVLLAGLAGQVVRMGRGGSQGGASVTRAVAHGGRVWSGGLAGPGPQETQACRCDAAVCRERAMRAGL
jgi:hypothetical protein